LTPEQEESYGRVGRWLHKVANVKLSTLLALALVVVGIALVLSFAIIGISEINVSNQRGDISELRIDNTQLNQKLTNVGVRLNELQQEIDQLRGGK
jgi:cell division septal protein FtsQ